MCLVMITSYKGYISYLKKCIFVLVFLTIIQVLNACGSNDTIIDQNKGDSVDTEENATVVKPTTVTAEDTLIVDNAIAGMPKKLIVNLRAIQDGTGVPSPDNIRAIEGVSEVGVTITDGSGLSANHDISLEQTVYGGELDLVSGVLRITAAMYDLSQTSWAYQESVRSFYASLDDFEPELKENASSSATYYGLCDTYDTKSYTNMAAANTTYSISQRNDQSVKRVYIRTDGTDQITPSGHAVFEIRTPIEVQLTPEEVELYSGLNQIISDDKITLEYLAETDSYLSEETEAWDSARIDEIEPYYQAEMADTIEKVRRENDSPALVFISVSDIHRYSQDAQGIQTFDKMINNMRHFCHECKVDFVLNLGDLTDGAATQETTLQRGYEATRDFMTLGVPYYFVNGNHDTNYAYSGHPYFFTMEENVKAYYSATRGTNYNASEAGTDYYVDYDWTDTRLIVLNANNVDEALEFSFGTTTAAWFKEALKTTKKVILAIHQSPINTQVGINTDYSAEIINEARTFVENGGTLIMLSGHSHFDMAFVSPWLSITQDCQRFSNTKDSQITTGNGDTQGIFDYVGSIVKNGRAPETYTEDLWSVCIYKPDQSEFDIIRFGAGDDRYFHVEPIVPGTVTSRFDEPIWSTSDDTVATVVDGVITGVSAGRCGILATDADGNYECWTVDVT